VTAPSPHAIEVRDLVKHFGGHPGRTAVAGLSLDIRRGELLSLLGPNGAGKSTTLRILTTLLPPTSGSILVCGRPLPQETTLVKPLLGLVPQEVALYEMLSARNNLRFFGRLYGLRGAERERRIGELLQAIELADRADEPVHTLSGGMQRRVNIAAALIHDPEIVFLDEPTVGLDPISRTAIWKIVTDLRSRGKTLVLTTHYMEEAEALSDRVAIVDHGKLIAVGATAELIRTAGLHTGLNLTVAGRPEDVAACVQLLQSLPEVSQVRSRDGQVRIDAANANQLLPGLLQKLVSAGTQVRSVEVTSPNLGDVFLHYTGRDLRE
jgi:ABC-2 type transport system ATP-binding protein